MHLIEVRDVYKIYNPGENQVNALDGVSITIDEGEFVAIIGQSGSGKSTLVQLLDGLERASSGKIYYNGQDIYDKSFDMRGLRAKVGLVFQYPEHQLFETTVINDVQFGPKNLGLPLLEVEFRSYEALKMTGIGDDLIDVSPFALSGGQKRRVAIAGVLAMKPEVLVLDEPAAGLDPAGRAEIFGLLKKLHKENNITVIIVSHSMEDIAKYVERLIVMNNGSIVLDGKPAEIFQFEKELEKIGLGVPQAAKVIHQLRDAGALIKGEYITADESAEAIYKWLKNGEYKR